MLGFFKGSYGHLFSQSFLLSFLVSLLFAPRFYILSQEAVLLNNCCWLFLTNTRGEKAFALGNLSPDDTLFSLYPASQHFFPATILIFLPPPSLTWITVIISCYSWLHSCSSMIHSPHSGSFRNPLQMKWSNCLKTFSGVSIVLWRKSRLFPWCSRPCIILPLPASLPQLIFPLN